MASLGDDLLPVVAFGDFAGVHQHHQCAAGHDLGVLDLEIDRHGLFQLACRSSRRRRSCWARPASPARRPSAACCAPACRSASSVKTSWSRGARWPAPRRRMAAIRPGCRRRVARLAPSLPSPAAAAARPASHIRPCARRSSISSTCPLPLHLGEGGGPVVLRHGVVFGPVGNEAGLVGVEVRGVDLLREW